MYVTLYIKLLLLSFIYIHKKTVTKLHIIELYENHIRNGEYVAFQIISIFNFNKLIIHTIKE